MLGFLDRRLLVTVVSLLLVVGVAGAAALRSGRDGSLAPAAEVFAVAPAPLPGGDSPPAEQPEYLYILREYEGRLAVFAPGEDAPSAVFERFVHHLPAFDQIQLREGVRVYSQAELLERIEDYTS